MELINHISHNPQIISNSKGEIMKRVNQTVILLVLCVLLIALAAAGCSSTSAGMEGSTSSADVQGSTAPPESTVESTTVPTTQATTTPEETFIPEIYPDMIGIYIPAGDGTAARKLITKFAAERVAKKDIDCFEIITSNEDRLEGSSFSSIWKKAWDGYKNAENSKIGFRIDFELDSGKIISKMLLKPSDSHEFFDYVEIYMYDDINQTPGVWYTHLEDDDMREETIISSIKLTSGSRIAEVGDITLTAFIYNGEDNFDEGGNYIGLIFETITITQ